MPYPLPRMSYHSTTDFYLPLMLTSPPPAAQQHLNFLLKGRTLWAMQLDRSLRHYRADPQRTGYRTTYRTNCLYSSSVPPGTGEST